MQTDPPTLALNPRWVNYARVNGRDPEEQLAHDREYWKGGSMCGFLLWGREVLAEFSRQHPEAFAFGRLLDHAAYDAWLDALPAKPNSCPDCGERYAGADYFCPACVAGYVLRGVPEPDARKGRIAP
jgi:hypothetical protein